MDVRRLLGRPAVRFALLCVAALPLTGCAGLTISCSGKSTESGQVVVTGAPAATERGATFTLDLTGTRLDGEGKDRCITYISTNWSNARCGYQEFPVPKEQRCAPLQGFTIEVKAPTVSPIDPNATALTGSGVDTVPYTGGTLTIQANGHREEVESADSRITYAGGRLIATRALEITVPAPANGAPSADLFARYAPMPPASLTTGSGDYGVEGAAIDARLSTDPEGGALSYAWDLDGDGAYDDAADGGTGATGLAAGVAIVPASRRQLNSGQTATIAVGVQVTDAGGLTATRRLDLTVQGDYPAMAKVVGLAPTLAAPGAAVTLTFAASSGTEATCTDPDGANPLSAAGRFLDIAVPSGDPGRTLALTAGAAGAHRVTVAVWFGHSGATPPNPTSCADWTAANVRYTWSDVYVSAASRQAKRAYRARVRLTTTRAVPIASDVSSLGILTGVIGRGRYALSAPAKAKGVARPKALALFRRGDYAASAPAVDFLGAGARETPIATSTLLLRGTGGALACVRADSMPTGVAYAFLGGTGAARRLVAHALAEPARATLPARPAKKVTAQRRPVRGNATMAATTGRARGLTAACRALIRHLP